MPFRCLKIVSICILVLPACVILDPPSAAFGKTDLSRAAVVMEASTEEILYAKNPDDMLPPASTTKLMSAVIVMDRAALSSVVTVSRNAASVRPYRMGLKAGDRLTVEALLYAMLLKSANDAAVALAEAVSGSEEEFVQLINEKTELIGADRTRFINSHGLPGFGQYTTASDLSKIMKHAMGYPKLREILGTPVAGFSTEKGKLLILRNTDKLLGTDEGLIGGKTGFTLSARHCFVCAAERDGETIIVSVLGSPSRKALWRETQELIDKGFQGIAASQQSFSHLIGLSFLDSPAF